MHLQDQMYEIGNFLHICWALSNAHVTATNIDWTKHDTGDHNDDNIGDHNDDNIGDHNYDNIGDHNYDNIGDHNYDNIGDHNYDSNDDNVMITLYTIIIIMLS